MSADPQNPTPEALHEAEEFRGTQEVGERFEVSAMHAQIMREQNEPRDGFEPIPPWLSIVFGGLLFWGGFYLSTYSGDFRADVFDQPNPRMGAGAVTKAEEVPTTPEGLARLGETIYRIRANCQSCHGPDGNGTQGVPPLNGSEWVAGDKASVARLSRIVLHGLNGPVQVKGATFNAQMPAWGGILKDYQIAAVLTYIRTFPDSKGEPILPGAVAAAREKEKGRGGPWTADALEAIPKDYTDPGAPVVKAEEKKEAKEPAKEKEKE